tara:strand:+ start:981 stop:1373 length:393 start_codon:yes stop_codon:yes gene_type:complete
MECCFTTRLKSKKEVKINIKNLNKEIEKKTEIVDDIYKKLINSKSKINIIENELIHNYDYIPDIIEDINIYVNIINNMDKLNELEKKELNNIKNNIKIFNDKLNMIYELNDFLKNELEEIINIINDINEK